MFKSLHSLYFIESGTYLTPSSYFTDKDVSNRFKIVPLVNGREGGTQVLQQLRSIRIFIFNNVQVV